MIVLGHRVLEYWRAKMGDVATPSAAIGWEREGIVCAAALFHGYQPGGNMDVGFVIDPPLARGFLQAVGRYAFVQCKCTRLTARPPKSHLSAINQLKRAGFEIETELPRYFGAFGDGLQLVLSRETWMKENADEQPVTPAAA